MQCSRDLFGYERHKSLDLSSVHMENHGNRQPKTQSQYLFLRIH